MIGNWQVHDYQMDHFFGGCNPDIIVLLQVPCSESESKYIEFSLCGRKVVRDIHTVNEVSK